MKLTTLSNDSEEITTYRTAFKDQSSSGIIEPREVDDRIFDDLKSSERLLVAELQGRRITGVTRYQIVGCGKNYSVFRQLFPNPQAAKTQALAITAAQVAPSAGNLASVVDTESFVPEASGALLEGLLRIPKVSLVVVKVDPLSIQWYGKRGFTNSNIHPEQGDDRYIMFRRAY